VYETVAGLIEVAGILLFLSRTK